MARVACRYPRAERMQAQTAFCPQPNFKHTHLSYLWRGLERRYQSFMDWTIRGETILKGNQLDEKRFEGEAVRRRDGSRVRIREEMQFKGKTH
jgi:hypothetical protein